ncbi:MAG TPA: FAD binding domain-containing protein, partial [Acetobacteraceae bacterium]|nr:FAD binding domain-containing protein [Acetobacteraceae bacterium]
MRPFVYERAATAAAATDVAAAAARQQQASYLAGGTTLVDLMKLDVLTPAHVIDVNHLPLTAVTADKHGLHIGALARMSDLAADPRVRQRFPVIAEALLFAASGQLRNMASIGG